MDGQNGNNMSSLIDDAAVLSGSDDDDDEEDEEGDEGGGNEYIKDDFVVDDAEEEKEANDGLLDSDDDDDDDDDDDGGGAGKRRGIRKMKDRLTQEDLDLIDEAKGTYRGRPSDGDFDADNRKISKLGELRNELYIDDEDGDKGKPKKKSKSKRPAEDTFDEEGMEDFIDDDVGNRGRYRDELDMDGPEEGVSEAQISEANDIFGTEFLDFMAENDADQDDLYDDENGSSKRKYRERGVGVDLGIDESDSDDIGLSEDDDDGLFGSDDDEDDGKTAEQRAEALRLKREKRRLAKEERRKKQAEQRKARLRRAFEPVQLIENFCTDRDDEIRSKDAPERFFDWKTPFHGPQEDISSITLAEEKEAMWIVKRIPEISSEYALAEMLALESHADENANQKTLSIIESIIRTLRFLHRDKLEPEFIKMYRADDVTSPAVRENIYRIMDEDTEWERLLNAKIKVEKLLDTITVNVESDEALGADEEYVAKLKEDLKHAQDRLDESVRDEETKKAEIEALDQNDDDDDDDDLFGDDDDDVNDDPKKAVSKNRTFFVDQLSMQSVSFFFYRKKRNRRSL